MMNALRQLVAGSDDAARPPVVAVLSPLRGCPSPEAADETSS